MGRMGLFNRNKKAVPSPVSDEQKTLHKHLDFTASEQYRLLRANLHFTVPEGVKCPVIGITSSIRGEGKSTTAINLSYVLAEKGSKVLLIDGDLRIPSVAKKLGIESKPGLTDLLLGATANVNNWRSSLQDNLYILPSGDIPPNPSELLGSSRMENALQLLREKFDYIIIDLPPVNLVSDVMAIAGHITGLLLVIREDYTTKRDVEVCIRQVRLANMNILGVVMNENQNDAGGYRHYSKYKRYRYYRRYYRYYQTYEQTPEGKPEGEAK